MRSWSIRSLIATLCLVLGASVARADRLAEITHMHLAALGGKERVDALASLRATGTVLAGGKRIRFTMTAARPNRLRLETEGGGRTLVQAYGGEGDPWELDTGSWPPRYRAMTENARKTFVADAEFDDPLVGAEKRGFVLEFVGEAKEEDRTFLHVRATRRFAETFSLLIDPKTYLIAWRVEDRLGASGDKTRVLTFYDDYRAVNGVLLAHRLSVAIGGKPAQQTTVERIEPSPKLTPETFVRPQTGKATPGR